MQQKGKAGEGAASKQSESKEEAAAINEHRINPKTRRERVIADKDRHNGSGGAFEATEEGGDEEDDTR